MEEKAKAAFWMPALIYGAILGFVGILLSVIFYLMNLTVENWTQWTGILVGIIVLIFCLRAYRKEYLGGYATYGQMFVMALMIGIISTILATIFSYILFTLIDPELADKIKLAAQEKILNNPRIPEGRQDAFLERIDKSMQTGRRMITGFIFGIIWSAIIGLIVAAFMKKEQTPGEPAA